MIYVHIISIFIHCTMKKNNRNIEVRFEFVFILNGIINVKN